MVELNHRDKISASASEKDGAREASAAEVEELIASFAQAADLAGKNNGATESDLETCFNALYGYITLSLQHKEVSEETKKSMKQISAFLAMLAHRYKMEQEGIEAEDTTHN